MQPAGSDQSTLEIKCMRRVSEAQVVGGTWDKHVMLPGGAVDDEVGTDIKIFAMKARRMTNDTVVSCAVAGIFFLLDAGELARTSRKLGGLYRAAFGGYSGKLGESWQGHVIGTAAAYMGYGLPAAREARIAIGIAAELLGTDIGPDSAFARFMLQNGVIRDPSAAATATQERLATSFGVGLC
eukprot:365621-Amphidinium_carterae.1